MMNKRGFGVYTILILAVVFAFFLIVYYFGAYVFAYYSAPDKVFSKFAGGIVKGNPAINLYFYDKNTKCKLNGEIYVDNILAGKTERAFFSLTEEQYGKYVNKTLCIFGNLDGCFKEYSNWVYENCFILNLSVTREKFERNSIFPFQADIEPRQPYKRAMMQFINPQQVSGYFGEIQPVFSTLKDIRKIIKFVKTNMEYVDDRVFGQKEYWLMPKETLQLKKGDCEDWGAASLSLIRAYDNKLKCYALVLPTHMSIFCYLENSFYIFDMNLEETKSVVAGNWNMIEEREKLRTSLQKYFDSYGIDESARKIIYAFNDVEFYEFKDNEDFINWMLEFYYQRKLR